MSGSQDEIPPPPPPPSQTPTQQTPHTEVIQNGNGPVSITTDTQGQIKVLPPRTAEEILARERERKARTTLLMALPEDHLAKFHKMTDAKEMWDAIKSRFGGNDESKKMQKYILKQQFEGFSVSNSEGLHKGYDRFQSLLSQLEIHGAGVSTEDANQKFLRSLPSVWSQVALIMRTKPGVDSLSFDDLYNNLRVFENDVKGSTASYSSTQNMAFVSENTSSTNDVSTAFLRYIDTRPNDDALRKCILKGPYIPTIVTTPAVPATEDSPAIPEQTSVETVMNMTPENRAHFESEKEVIHLILTGIGDEIYSTVDACQTAQEMWEAIERLQQVATMQVNVQFLQQLQPEWSRFVTIVKQQHKLDEVSYHKLFDILKQYQKEVNELRAERMAKNANPLALVATAQTLQDPYYQTSKPHKSYAPTSKASLPTRSHATTRYKGKEIAKPITPPSESASEEDSDPKQAQKDKDM
ncbi:hypothetical protein Tco_1033596 [Tanacetum coccineum]